MKNENEWNPLSELLSNLIVKYADDLDIDAMPYPDMHSEKADSLDALKKPTKEPVANDSIT